MNVVSLLNTSNLTEMSQKPDDVSEKNWRQGRNLARLREIRGFSQEELAVLVECDAKYISLIERGKRGISAKMMPKMCRALEVEESEFFEAVGVVGEAQMQWTATGDPLTHAMAEDWQQLDSVNRTRLLLFAKKLLRRSSGK